MADTIERILVVQQHDCRIRDIRKELADIPARKEQEQGRLDEHRAALSKAEEDLKLQQAEIKKLELEAESGRGKITKLRQQQMEIKTNKEFKAMATEIQGAELGISALEDRELGLMEDLEKARGVVDEKKKALAEEAAAVQADVEELDSRVAAIERELKDVESQREAAASEIDAEWLSRYEHIFSRKKDIALVKLAGGVCGGCHMNLPPAVYHDTQKKDAMVCCNFCGRLLY